MYDEKTGVWIEYGDKICYDFETTYYLKYNIEKAKIALNKLFKEESEVSQYSNRCVYYHIYIDLLMQAMGQIANRFLHLNKENEEEQKIRNKNQEEYQFNNKNYPLLSNKKIRNFVEHIDEKNLIFIRNNGGVGGFNVIFEETTEEDEKGFLNTKTQNNTLDLKNHRYCIYDNREQKTISLDLNKLCLELKSLSETNEKIWKYITNNIKAKK